VAVLQLSEGFDFALVDLDDSATHVFTLANVGEATATALGPTVAPSPFAITSTDCGATLEPDASCEIEVAFAPQTIGPFKGTLAVGYHDGAADETVIRDLVGGGAGQTRNLIVNPGGENCTGGGPPDGWVEVVGENWTCASFFDPVTPHGGNTMFFPDATPDNTEPDLAQDVPVPDEAASLVPVSEVGLRFIGWAASPAIGDDPRRFRLEFLDGAGSVIGDATWDSGWDSGDMWSQTEHVRIPHPGTAAIRVHLDCDIVVPNRCSALFDDLQLHFFYPPP
jgi:hypothetical protein